MKKIICLLFLATACYGDAIQDLQAEINNLKAENILLKAGVSAEVGQDVQVVNAINVALAPRQSLTVGTVAGGATVDLPVYYRVSTAAVSALQFDLLLPNGLTVASVTPGIAAQAAGKSAQGNPVVGGHRILIFGLNQTAIPTGPVAIVRLNTGGNLGKLLVPISAISGSSPSGASVPITGQTGSVTIQ